MARLRQYDKGRLDGKLEAAENELYYLYRIKDEMNEQPHESNIICIRIHDTEKFLLEHGRSIDVSDEDAFSDEYDMNA